MSSLGFSVRSPDPAQWSIPRYHKIHLYQWMDAEGRIITVSSGASNPELDAPHHELYGNKLRTQSRSWPPHPPLEGALEAELVRSEGRRSALAESLTTAYSAMKHQQVCLQEQDRHMIHTEAWLEQLLFKQEFITSKICRMKIEKSPKKPATLARSELEEEQTHRITALEEQIKDIHSKLGAGAAVQRPWSPPSSEGAVQRPRSPPSSKDAVQRPWSPPSSEGSPHAHHGRNGLPGELLAWDELQRYTQEVLARRHQAEQEKDTLQLQMTSVSSQLLQARLGANRLARERLALRSELDASRSINEDLLLEVASLRQNMQTLEASLAGDKSTELESDAQIRHLMEEKKQLLSQKELLMQTLRRREGRPKREDLLSEPDRYQPTALRPSPFLSPVGSASQTDTAATGVIVQTPKERPQKTLQHEQPPKHQQPRHHEQSRQHEQPPQHKQPRQHEQPPQHKQPRQHEQPPQHQLPQQEQPPQYEKPPQHELPQHKQVPQHEQQPQHELPQSEEPPQHEQPTQNKQTPLHEQPPHNKQPTQIKQPQQYEQPPQHELPPQNKQPTQNKEPPQNKQPPQHEQPPQHVLRTSSLQRSKRSEKSESSRRHPTPRAKLSRLLRKLEGLLTGNVKVKIEKEQILCDLLAVLKDVMDAEVSSGVRRTEVESLLGEHLNLQQNYHNRENQILAVIIELQHLRRAYEAALRGSSHPEDRRAKGWVSRVALIKSCLEKLQTQEQQNKLVAKENKLFKDKLQS